MILAASIRLAFGLLFLVAGASKLLRTRSVKRIVREYAIVPRSLVPAVSRILGPAELISGAALLASFGLPVDAIAWKLGFSLLLVFSVAIASALARGIKVPCGCGLLTSSHVITISSLLRNLMLIAGLFTERYLRHFPHR